LQKQGNGEPKVGENCTILKKVKFARRRHNDCGWNDWNVLSN